MGKTATVRGRRTSRKNSEQECNRKNNKENVLYIIVLYYNNKARPAP